MTPGNRTLPLLVALALSTASPAADQDPTGPARPQPQISRGQRVVSAPTIAASGRHDLSPALRDIPIRAPRAERSPHAPLMLRQPGRQLRQLDPVLQASLPAQAAPNTVINFEGVHNVDGVLPPDTNGDIGPNHYVQWVNKTFAVYSRSGSVIYGPASGSTIWTGFGGPCESQNDGDPIVLYDHLADRWLLSQFALPNNFFGILLAPFYQCIAVSQTPDPTGPYYRYQYQFSKLNDYPKLGVWPDGYYMSMNQFSSGSLQFAGQGAVAFNRAAMLAGQPAPMIYFDLASVDPQLGGMLPSDLDGPAPPAGSPNYFVQMDDDAFGHSTDRLQLWRFHADWGTPSASTFTGPVLLPVAPFDSNLCDYATACIPQPGTAARVHALSDRLMYRLQFRNVGAYQSLVVNHTVDVDGADHAGVRWYELRDPGGTPAIHQQGTYAPDAFHRWMASAAMDAAGNVAIAYNVSGQSLAPSIRYAARLVTDPPGVLGLGENDMIAGSGSQEHGSGRWGDYSMLSVDPADGCTFWATAQYFAATSAAGWQTRVAAFRLAGCGAPSAPPDPPAGLTATGASASRINVAWLDRSDNEAGFAVERCLGSASSCSATGSFSQAGQTGPGTTTFADAALQASTAYSYRVRAFNSGGSSAYSNVADAATHPLPAVTVVSTVAAAAEAGPVSGVFTIGRDTGQDGALAVTYSLAGTAIKGTDYQTVPLVASIPAGASSATVTIVPVDDTAIEPPESVVLTISVAPGYTTGAPASATVTIASDELSTDLVVTSLTVPATAGSGNTIEVSDTTGNQGADAAGSTVTSFHLSTDYLLGAGDVQLGTRLVPGLAPGASSSATTAVTLPAHLAPGSYVLFAKADGPEQLRETSEWNNTRTASMKIGPDLAIAALTAPAMAGAGTAFPATETTRNQGGGPAGASTTRFYLSVNYLLDSADTPLQGRTVPALDAAGTSSATTMLTIPAGVTAGNYYLIASADERNTVAEHTETNNAKYTTIRVGGDLIVSALSLSSSRGPAGATVTVTDTTRNNGAETVGASTTAFYISANYALDAGDTRLPQARTVASLAPGVASTGTTAVTLPDLAPGTWYLIANADDGAVVPESFEGNNTRMTYYVVAVVVSGTGVEARRLKWFQNPSAGGGRER